MLKHKRNIPWLPIFIICFMINLAEWKFVYSQNAPSDGVSFQAITFIDANKVIAVGDSGTIALSTDMGKTWSMRRNVNHITTPLNGVAFANAARGFVVGTNGVLLMTTNGGGTSWDKQLINSTATLHSISFSNEMTGTIVGDNGMIYHSLDGGNNWFMQTSGVRLNLNSVVIMDNKTGIAVGDHGKILRTTDDGNTWTNLSSSFIPYNFYSVSFNGLNNGIIVGENGTILHTTNGGLSWTLEPSGVMQTLFCSAFPSSNFSIAAGASATILTSIRGTNWLKQSNITRNTIIATAFADAKVGIAVGAQQTIIRTTDGAITWNAVIPALEKPVPLPAITALPERFLKKNIATAVGTNGLILQSKDFGAIMGENSRHKREHTHINLCCRPNECYGCWERRYYSPHERRWSNLDNSIEYNHQAIIPVMLHKQRQWNSSWRFRHYAENIERRDNLDQTAIGYGQSSARYCIHRQ